MTSAEIFDIDFRRTPTSFTAVTPVFRKILDAKPNVGHRALSE